MLSEAQHRAVERLIRESGEQPVSNAVPLPGGGNNRVYRIETDGGPRLVKAYYHHPRDGRDRLASEYAFTTFAWEMGIDRVPRPYGADPDSHVGLYEFVSGRRPGPDEPDAGSVRQALAFYHALNRHRGHVLAQALPLGAEACFTLAAHLQTVDRRLDRLSRIESETPVHRDCRAFVSADLQPAWRRIRREVEERAGRLDLALDDALPPAERRVSPSDFGFHNALVESGGRLRFIDFEYAGWDDPAKTVCDFFCQPAAPAPRGTYAEMADALAAETGEPERHRRRFDLLLPVYRLKWICIMLNEFLVAGAERRRYAAQGPDDERAARQLGKARAALAELAEGRADEAWSLCP